jgi:hypothetical protein
MMRGAARNSIMLIDNMTIIMFVPMRLDISDAQNASNGFTQIPQRAQRRSSSQREGAECIRVARSLA